MTYQYIYKEKPGADYLIVTLHGTGGDEHDLISIAEKIAPDAAVIGVRGDVNESGNLRFFKRTGMGQYDLDDLSKRGQALHEFIQQVAQEKGFSPHQVILLGFSNGTNIALHIALNNKPTYGGLVLMAPLYPLPVPEIDQKLANTPVFVSMGENDPIVPVKESHHVIDILKKTGAPLTTSWVNGHKITYDLLIDLASWFKANFRGLQNEIF